MRDYVHSFVTDLVVVKFDQLEHATSSRREDSVQEFAAKGCDPAVEQFQNVAVVELNQVVGDVADAFVLALASPESNACNVLVIGLQHGIKDGLSALPSNLIPNMDLDAQWKV